MDAGKIQWRTGGKSILAAPVDHVLRGLAAADAGVREGRLRERGKRARGTGRWRGEDQY